MNSLRRPYRFEVENHEETSKLRMVVDQFATYIRKLKFFPDQKEINITDFDIIVRSMANVAEATFDFVMLHGNDDGLGDRSIVLPKLKKLVVNQCKSQKDILLRIDASSLEEFRVHDKDGFGFTKFFQNHKTIKNITMCQIPERFESLDYLQLTRLQIFRCPNLSHLRHILAHQPKLKYLNLLYTEAENETCDCTEDDYVAAINDEVFTAICDLKELEILKVGLGRMSPDIITPDLNFANLKELVMKATGITGCGEYDDFDSDVSLMRQDALFQKIFRKLINIPIPTLQSFKWSLKNCQVDKCFSSYEEEIMEAARRQAFAGLDNIKVDVFKKMAQCFPNLKYLNINMKTSKDFFNIYSLLQLFPHLETIILKVNTVFDGNVGELIQMNGNIKHIKVQKLKKNDLSKILSVTTHLESLEIVDSLFPLEKRFIVSLQASLPNTLKKLTLKLHSNNHNDFSLDNMKILQGILKNLRKCRIKLTGRCNFDSLSETIDPSIDRKISISLPRSPRSYYFGHNWDNYESYMVLWK